MSVFITNYILNCKLCRWVVYFFDQVVDFLFIFFFIFTSFELFPSFYLVKRWQFVLWFILNTDWWEKRKSKIVVTRSSLARAFLRLKNQMKLIIETLFSFVCFFWHLSKLKLSGRKFCLRICRWILFAVEGGGFKMVQLFVYNFNSRDMSGITNFN